MHDNSQQIKIPKVIHYCWLGGNQLPKDAIKCIDNWKKKLPGYEIKVWNEENYDITVNDYMREAYKRKKYAFVTDYMRLDILYQYGGIYMDTDVILKKDFKQLLNEKAFVGFEYPGRIGSCVIGAQPHNPIIKELIDSYLMRKFVGQDGKEDTTPNPEVFTTICTNHGLQTNDIVQKLDHITVLPMDAFCPYNPFRMGRNYRTKNTIAIHLFSASWKSRNERIRKNVNWYSRRIFGGTVGSIIAKVILRILRLLKRKK